MPAARHRTGHDTEKTHRRQEQRADGEARKKDGADPLPANRVIDYFVHGADIRERETRIDLTNHGTDVRHQALRVAPGPDDERKRPVSRTLRSEIDLGAAVLMHVVESRLIDDANDGQHILAVVAERNLRADRPTAREELSRETAIDHHLAHAVATHWLEGTPLDDAHAHHFDVAGADADDVDERRIAVRVTSDAGRTGNRDAVLTRRRRQRQRGGRADRRDAGDRLQ